MKPSRFASFLFLIACAQPARVAEPPVRSRWEPSAVDVYASSEMSPECRAATYEAVQLLRRQGVRAQLIWATEEHPALSLEPRYGEVAIKAGLPRADRWLAESLCWEQDGAVTAADIVLGDCSPLVVSYELLRVFGLEGAVDDGRGCLSPLRRAPQ